MSVNIMHYLQNLPADESLVLSTLERFKCDISILHDDFYIHGVEVDHNRLLEPVPMLTEDLLQTGRKLIEKLSKLN